MLSVEVKSLAERSVMALNTDVDQKLLAKARKLVDPATPGNLNNEEFKALVQRESAQRLGKLGGSEPRLKLAPRRH
jgi:hypothetical protein